VTAADDKPHTRRRIAYFGPAGTYTEEAARKHGGSDAEYEPYATIILTARAVLNGDADEAVTPIENSLQGAVTDTLDMLIHEPGLRIRGEIAIPIAHQLIVKPGTRREAIKTIYSHPQALGQCRRYLEREFPLAAAAAALSTAAAVEQVMGADGTAAAIAPRRAAELYGGEIIASGIQDDANNVTRFVVLGRADRERTGRDKTSICFSFNEDKPGQLYAVMGEFARRGLNLSKVESRPTRERLGHYYFLVDIEGHRDDPPVREALGRVEAMASLLKVFGSYPRYAA